jgi:hypothetical protein
MRILACLIAALLPASLARAHETFFVPPSPLTAGKPAILQLTSGMTFPTPETGPAASRVARAVALIGGDAQPFTVAAATPTTLDFAIRPDSAGLLVVAVDLTPHPIDLAPDKVAEYFAEVDPPAAVRAAYAAQPVPRQWHEVYTKHAKALLCVAPCTDIVSAQVPNGQAFEFVAADAGLRRFVLRAGGAPLSHQAVSLFTGSAEIRLRTDAHGEVGVPASARGALLLSSTLLRPPAAGSNIFTSDFATLLFTPAGD